MANLKNIEEKKITIKHFLNTILKAKMHKKESYYCPYIQVTYDGRNTQFLFDWTLYLDTEPFINKFTEEEFNNLINSSDPEDKKMIAEVEDIVSNAVIYEVKKYKSNHSFKGFGKRLAFYLDCYSCDIGSSVEESLVEYFKDNLTKKDFQKVDDKMIDKGLFGILKYVRKKFIPSVFEDIGNDLETEIETYYLLSSYLEYKENTREYYRWLFGKEVNSLEEYFSNQRYLNTSNEDKKVMKELGDLKSFDVYKNQIINSLRDQEEDIYRKSIK